jgi:1-acyl-sn-glycerol-3-phosphate acyltransferase
MLAGASTRVAIGDLQVNSISSDTLGASPADSQAVETTVALEPRPASRVTRAYRAVRSLLFLSVFAIHLLIVIAAGQRLVVLPLLKLFPRYGLRIRRAWLRLHAIVTTRLARTLGGMRLVVQGAIPRESVVVVMNHQSVMDIPVGVLLIPGPYPIIPTRDRYSRGVPGIATLVHLLRYPVVTQKRENLRTELPAIAEAADATARGDNSMLIFAEGHRTRDGQIGPFMRSGLRLVLERARRPVYCIVADGLWHARTTFDAATGFAGATCSVRILGPFAPPASDYDRFIDELRDRMVATLEDLRASRSPSESGASSAPAA